MMNEKIKELRDKAFLLVQEDLETVERDHAVMYREHLQMVNEKFAELIIQECLMICKSHKIQSTEDVWYLAHNETVGRIAENIEEYFEIK